MMGTPTKLRLILGENDCEKLVLSSGIPASLEELKKEIEKQLGPMGEFRLQVMDVEFDNEFVNLNSTADLQDKATLKVVKIPADFIILTPYTPLPNANEAMSSSAETDILSSSQTSVLSSSESTSSLRTNTWPHSFPIPEFKYDAELALQKANVEYQRDGILLNPSRKLKSNILESLASEILKFKAYPSLQDLDNVAAALIRKHPCLKERGSPSGYGGWKISLRDKMGNYHTTLRKIGCSELDINSLKRRKGEGRPNQVKKPRRAELNYCPDFPAGENKDSLEELRIALLSEVSKKNNQQVIKDKMERTFAYRRREVLEDMSYIVEFKSRWPALFNEQELGAEYTRITTSSLVSKFMYQLDQYSTQLIRVFKRKGGMAAQKINTILSVMDQNRTTEVKRECVLKALAVYLNENPTTLVKEYLDVDHVDAQQSMGATVLGIYVFRREGAEASDPCQDVGIIVEGLAVLQNLTSVAHACCLMLGLVYALNFAYPDGLKYTFEVIQKVLMELDPTRLSKKVQVLKNKLLE